MTIPRQGGWRPPASALELGWLQRLYATEFSALTGRPADWSAPPFAVSLADLDGQPGDTALLVRWTDPDLCAGATCKIDIWIRRDGTYQRVGSFLGAEITLAGTMTGGMADLLLDGATLLQWNGTAYAVTGRREGAAGLGYAPGDGGLALPPLP